MPVYRLAFLGFGNVGQALARLLLEKREELRAAEIDFVVTGIATGSHGIAIAPDGLDVEAALALADAGEDLRGLNTAPRVSSGLEFVQHVPADVLFENTPVNYETGEPARTHIATALKRGMHVATANKGPVVHAYRELTDLAAQMKRSFYFESAVMDGAPIFSLFRETLPAARLLSFRGILNSTTNLILTRMETEGETFAQAVAYAQSVGIAETDPSGDVDGWDAAIKVAALVTVLMGIPLKPQEVDRTGIRHIGQAQVQEAAAQGKRWKLVCAARRTDAGVEARVAPQLVGPESPLYGVAGTSSIVTFETDVLGELSVREDNPGPHTTAYGLLADFLNAVRSEVLCD